MRKRKIAILTYQDKLELYDDQFRNEFDGTEVIQYGSGFSYDVLIRNAQMIESMGYNAIVCRGYAAGLISKQVDIPIIIVEPDMLDVLSSMVNWDIKKDEKIGLLFHDQNNLLVYKDEMSSQLASIFCTSIEVFNYSDMADYYKKVEEIIMRGMTVFTGHNGIEHCKKVGKRCIPLYPGENAIRDAILEAIRIIDIRFKDINQWKRIEAVLENKNEGIISIDHNYSVELINRYAKELLNISSDSNKNIDIREYLLDIAWENLFKTSFNNIIVNTPMRTSLILDSRIITDASAQKEVFLFFRPTKNVVEEERKIRAENRKKKQYAKFDFDDIIGNSIVIEECKSKTRQCAKFDANVLIYGESGVGKELFAQCIHANSTRSKEPFYAINCAALPDNLLESELFGYSEGAFTGAKKGGKPGIFELAHKGTVFLDEIGELSLASQSALLRVIQEKEVRRIGDDGIIPVDVRIIAASHENINSKVENKTFRQDLFYRLNTLFLTIPPLREREDDIQILLKEFIKRSEIQYGLVYTGLFTDSAKNILMNYNWSGNVRELQNFVQRLFALEYYNKDITADDVKVLLSNEPEEPHIPFTLRKNDTRKNGETKTRITKDEIEKILAETNGNKAEAARLLGISRTHLWRLLNDK